MRYDDEDFNKLDARIEKMLDDNFKKMQKKSEKSADVKGSVKKHLQKIDKEQAKIFSKSLKEDKARLDSMVNRQFSLLDSFYKATDKETKLYIKNSMFDRQRELEDTLENMKSSFNQYSKYMSKKNRDFYSDIYSITSENLNDLQEEMSTRFAGMKEDVKDSLEDMQEGVKGGFTGLMKNITVALSALNIDSIKDHVEDKIDSYIENKRQVRSRTNNTFNYDDFNNAVSQVVDNGGYMNRDEASELVSDLVIHQGVKDAKYLAPYAKEISSGMKVLGASIDSYSNIMWRDMDTEQNGNLLREVNNIAKEVEDNSQLNVTGENLLQSINENIDDIYGITAGDTKKTTKMVGSLASIEAMQQSAANKGVDTMAGQLKDWLTKTPLELMDDERFNTFSSLTGVSAEQFAKASQDGPDAIYDIVAKYQKAIEGMDDTDMYNYKDLLQYGSVAEMKALKTGGKDALNYLKEAIGSTYKGQEDTEQGTDLMARSAGELVGWLDKSKNFLSDNPFIRRIADVMDTLDVKAINLAAVTYVASSLRDTWKSLGGGEFGKWGQILHDKTGGFLSGVKGVLGKKLGGLWGKFAGTTLGGKIAGKLGSARGILGGAINSGIAGDMSGIASLAKMAGKAYTAVTIGFDALKGYSVNANKWFGKDAGVGQRLSSSLATVLGGSSKGGLGDAIDGALSGAAMGASIGGVHGAIIGAIVMGIGHYIGGENIAKALDNLLSVPQKLADMLFGESDKSLPERFFDALKTAFLDYSPLGWLIKAISNFHPIDFVKSLFTGGSGSGSGTQKQPKPAPKPADTQSWLSQILSGISFPGFPGLSTIFSGLTGFQLPDLGIGNFFSSLFSSPSTQQNPSPAQPSQMSTNDYLSEILDVLNNIYASFQNLGWDKKSSIQSAISKGNGPLQQLMGGTSNSSGSGGILSSLMDKVSNFGKWASSKAQGVAGAISNYFSPSGAGKSFGISGKASAQGIQPSGLDVTAFHPNIDGSGAERWKPYVVDALTANGLATTPDMVNKVIKQIDTESGGNPSEIQKIQDVNSANGNPAQGLMQVIPPTFDANMFAGHGDITNGYDNMLAALNYAKNRYGSNLDGLGEGHGYAVGTPFVPSDQVALIHEGEMIVPADQNPMNGSNVSVGNVGDNSEVVEALTWAVYRLEAKFDSLIAIIGSGRRLATTAGYNDIDDSLGY